MKNKLMIIVAWLCFLPATAFGHSFWINCFESFSHKPGHAIVSLGYGHNLPMDDLLNSKNATLKVKSYDIFSPDMARHGLPLPRLSSPAPETTDLGITVYSGDIGLVKLGLNDKKQAGTYQVGVASEPGFFTMYENEKGRKKWAVTSMDQVKNAKAIIQSCLYKAMAKSCFTNGKWTQPAPLGHDLEIIPATDLSGIRAGDLAEFEVRFLNKSYTSTPSKIARITASSNTFGGPDKYYLAADLRNGKAQIRIPTSGQWVVSVYVNQDVEKDKDLSSLSGKCMQVHYSATLSFNVKP